MEDKSTYENTMSASGSHHETMDAVDTVEGITTNDTEAEFSGDTEVAPEAIGGASVGDLPAGYYRSFPFLGTLGAVILGTNGLYLACSMPLNVLTNINEDIGPDSNFAWITIIFSVVSASTYLLNGRLADLLGRRWVTTGFTVIGTIGTVICAAAPSIPVLIFGNALLGVNGGTQQSLVALIAELAPNKYRSYVTALVVNSALPVISFGPVFIRLMLRDLGPGGWRWSYGAAAICNGLSALLFYLAYHPPSFAMLHARSAHKVSPWRMVDFAGAALFAGGLTVFLLGLSWGGGVYPWKSGMVIGFIVGGAALLVLFVFWEVYGAKDYPLLPTHLFGNRPFMSIALASGIATMTFFALLLLWPVQLTLMYDSTLLGVGFKSCVIQSGVAIGYFVSGAIMKPLRRQKWQFIGGMIVLAAFIGGMAGTTPATQTMAIVFLLVVGMSIGWIECLALTLAPFCLRHDEIGIALGFVGTTRAALAALAQTIFTTIYTNKIATEQPALVTPAVLDAGLPASSVPALLAGLASGNMTGIPGLTPAIEAAAVAANELAYSRSFQLVYYAAVAFGIFGIAMSLYAPNTENRFNSAISRRMQGTEDATHDTVDAEKA
ncbi:hypothetical protein SEUCBS139899_009858 [Sporothrix eucalyptigena]|uniref:Major facilitator superfamily (MFS) profile domain-containing protein n=1 Tax=Sporothrix eucalyptigena TaxID=1812306 RepID=A0ABP0D1P2_9PEZI